MWCSGIIKCTFPCLKLVKKHLGKNAGTADFISISFYFDLFLKGLSQLTLTILNTFIMSVTPINEDLTFVLVERNLLVDWGI